MAYYKPEELDTMRNTLKEAKANPDNPRSQEIFKRINEGKMNFELKALGLPTVDVPRPKIDMQAAMAGQREIGDRNVIPAEDSAQQGNQVERGMDGKLYETQGQLQSVVPKEKFFSPVTTTQGVFSDKKELQETGQDVKEMYQNIKTRFGQVGEDIVNIAQDDRFNFAEKAAMITGKGLGRIGGFIFDDLLVGTGKLFLTQEGEDRVQKIAQDVIAQMGDGVQNTPALMNTANEFTEWFNGLNPEAQEIIKNGAGGSASFLADMFGIKGTQIAGRGAGMAAETTLRTGTDVATGAAKWAETNIPPAVTAIYERTPSMADVTPRMSGISESLVAGINRITPSERTQFRQMSGESMDSWLVDRGLTGTREDTLVKLGNNFRALRENVDDAIDRIPGEYRDNRINVVAQEAAEHARAVESPELGRMNELLNKAQGVGLTPSEINELKRYYERNVKVGYMQDPTKTGENVQRATNRDSQLREYLFEIADENGFDNLRDINREIQQTKFLADKIAGRMEGQGANNMMSLTDWIAISPAAVDPTFIAGFTGKKLFGTETARSMFARLFSAGRPTKDLPRADLDEITRLAQERMARNVAAEEERLTNFLMAKDLQEAGFTMSEGDRAFITENPIPLTRQEQHLLKVAEETAKYDEMLKYILDKKAEGFEIGDGFIMREAQLQLPAAGQTTNRTRPDFEMGARSQSTIDAQEMERVQSQNNPQMQQNITNDTNSAIDNSNVPQGTMVEQALRADKDAVDQAVMEMEAELSGEVRPSVGENFVQTADGGAYRFNELPSWIPQNLRSADLMSRVLRNINEGRQPRANAGNEIELQKLVEERVKSRAEAIKNADTGSGVFSGDAAFAAALMVGGTYFMTTEDGSLLPVVAIGSIMANPLARKQAIKQLDEMISNQRKIAADNTNPTSVRTKAGQYVTKLRQQKQDLLNE